MRLAVRRIALLLLLVVVVLGLFAGWRAYQLRQDLKGAEDAVNRLEAAVRTEDVTARNQAAKDLADSAAAAADRSDGIVWGLAEHAPIYGDDAAAVTAISSSLDTLASGAIQPLLYTVDSVDGAIGGGRINLDTLESIREPVRTARASASEARDQVGGLDGDYVSAVSKRADEYVDRLDQLVSGLMSSERALEVLPGILGAHGPRDYLLIFQNNAEIRATGGIPGSWAQIHTADGRMEIVKQGSSADFVKADQVTGEETIERVPVSKQEKAVYSDLLGMYWQDATFTPNWPRAAELLTQRWERRFFPSTLDGVISLDPVAMSYLLNGTGPIAVGDVTLDSGNLVDQLLSVPYLTMSGEEQDTFFAEAARSIFNAVTSSPASPVDLAQGMNDAVSDRRLLVSLFDPKEASVLENSPISGVVPANDRQTPRVVIALNDATASKMSYYLRYDASVDSTGCEGDRQGLAGQMKLSQTITSDQGALLPDFVTGPGDIGIPVGSQLVVVRLYSPTGGSIEGATVDGQKLDVEPVELDGRQVITLVAQLSGPTEVPITWTMTAGAGQSGDGQVLVTPGVVRGSQDSRFASSC